MYVSCATCATLSPELYCKPMDPSSSADMGNSEEKGYQLKGFDP